MARRINALDWSRTPLGDIRHWGAQLRASVEIMLNSRYPMFIWWGPELTNLYNDSYIPVLGKRHPAALGLPAPEVWTEIWGTVGEQARIVLEERRGTWNEEFLLMMERNDFLEETYFTFSYSPILGDDGSPVAVFCACTEETPKVLSRRRLKTVRDLVELAGSLNPLDAIGNASRVLSENRLDVPFARIYLGDEIGNWHLTGASGAALSPQYERSELAAEADTPWPFAEALQRGDIVVVDLPDDAAKLGVRRAAVVPIESPREGEIAGFFVAGLSPLLEFNDEYRGYLNLIARHLSTAVATARARADDRRTVAALAEIDRAKTRFFTDISHEFRTPLTLMLGPIEDALRVAEDAALREQLDMAQRNAQRLLHLVNSLLDFSRVEAGRAQAVFRPTDLARLTRELASVFRSAIEKAGLTYTVDCPPLTGATHVDREKWETIVLNLLSNALKYTLHGAIDLSLREVEDRVELVVRDSGIGISEEELPKVFDRFHRTSQAKARAHEGSGIGLAHVKELARLHGGDVRATSVVGRGSQFVISIPKGSKHLPPDQVGERSGEWDPGNLSRRAVEKARGWLPPDLRGTGEQPVVAEPSTGRPRVLWIDDNPDMRTYVSRLLSDRYDIEAVPDGLLGLESLRRRVPDLVLTDVMVPGMDGFELLRTIRGDDHLRAIPVILISARAGEESRLEALRMGADDYLVKPFNSRELQGRVDVAISLADERRRSADALRTLEGRRRATFDTAAVGIAETSLDGGLTEVNAEFCRITGYSRDELRQMSIADLTHPEDLQRDMENYSMAQTGEIRTYSLDQRYRRRDGSTIWVRLDNSVVRDADDRPLYGITVIQDITDRKAAAAALQSSEEQLRDNDRRKDEFLATLAHELRNPLAPIRNVIGAYRLTQGEGIDLQKSFSIVERQVNHLVRLVDDLLEISRYNLGRIQLRTEETDLAEVIRMAVETSAPLFEEAHHDLTISLPDARIRVKADPVRLAQVIANLLNNAAKYTDDSGRIELAVTSGAGLVRIAVRDNGMGIRTDMLHRVFDAFEQIGDSAHRARGGLGIGLTLVRTLVELLGGSVEARSEGVGKGSEFIVTLPVSEAGAPTEEAPPPPDRRGQLANSPRLLVVDDNRDAADTLSSLLEVLGARTRVAYDGDSAIQVFQEFRPDVVFLDIGLPGMSGYDVARAIRNLDGPPVLLVALTGWGQDGDRARALASGFDHHLSKPADIAQLLQLVGMEPLSAQPATSGGENASPVA
jgi:PAS domain S-box-containing protein